MIEDKNSVYLLYEEREKNMEYENKCFINNNILMNISLLDFLESSSE